MSSMNFQPNGMNVTSSNGTNQIQMRDQSHRKNRRKNNKDDPNVNRYHSGNDP